MDMIPIASGMTSTVYRSGVGNIVKQLTTNNIDQFNREVFWLEKLAGTGVAPELISYDQGNLSIVMTDCGEPISLEDIPPDWRAQLKAALEVLKVHNCRHNDLSEKEVLARDGKITLVDFGAGTVDIPTAGVPGYVINLAKRRIFADENIVELIELLFGHGFSNAEPHCLVIWDASMRDELVVHLRDRFTILQEVLFHPKALEPALFTRSLKWPALGLRSPNELPTGSVSPCQVFFSAARTRLPDQKTISFGL